MSQSPVVTLAAGAIGATIGLLAPLIAAALLRLGVTRDAQRAVADEIIDLLTGGRPGAEERPLAIDALLGGPRNLTRRSLYGLTIRLRDGVARRACEDLIEAAARDGATEEQLVEPWQRALREVGRVHRGERRRRLT